MELRTRRKLHMHVSVIVPEYEIVYMILRIKLFCKFIQRFVNTSEHIFPIMRQSVAL